MQEERTQQKNRDKAMKIIRARVADHFAQIAQDEQDAERKSTVWYRRSFRAYPYL